MKLKISFKHLDHTEALDERIREKSEKLEKFFKGNIQVQWVCWVHENQHWADIKVHGPKFDFFAKASSDNMYKSLDLVVDKIERQVEKQKDHWKNKLHTDSSQSPKNKQIRSMIHDEEVVADEIEDQSA